MANARLYKIRFWCEIALAVLSVALAVVFITQVADIYYSGEAAGIKPYTRDIVWGRLKYLIAPLVVWALAVIGCFVLSVLAPREQKKRAVSPVEKVAKLRSKMPGKSEPRFEKEFSAYSSVETGRRWFYAVAGAVAVGVATYAIIYLSDRNNFLGAAADATRTVNDDILELVKNVFPFILLAALLYIGIVLYEYFTAKNQLTNMGKILAACKGTPISRSPLAARLDAIAAAADDPPSAGIWVARGIVFTVAVVFIALGAVNGGAADVLLKAVRICTECIGLG